MQRRLPALPNYSIAEVLLYLGTCFQHKNSRLLTTDMIIHRLFCLPPKLSTPSISKMSAWVIDAVANPSLALILVKKAFICWSQDSPR
jgi:hypothetical protein